jgi:hypothetical protein
MSTVMKASEFVKRLKDVATNYSTLYVMGCFGAPMTASNKTRYCENNDYNKQATRTKMIKAASEDTFGFDCVGLIKGILWGWAGDKSKVYGGATYTTNGVPDISADQMIGACSGVTADFSSIIVGEAVWCTGHIGVYIGDGLAVECSPAWKNRVQITAVGNIGTKSGYNARKWTKHGKLPYIDYDVSVKTTTTTKTTVSGAVSTGVSSDEKTIWSYLFSKIGNAYGVAGLMGNLYAESALRSNNLQNSYEASLGYTDATYTAAVDSGKYANFATDSAGYGLAQWTYHTRKAALLSYAQSQSKSIGDLTMQLEYLVKELTSSYPAVLSALKSATSVKSASDAVLTKFERPANQSTSVKNTRASYGQKYFDAYSGKATSTSSTATATSSSVKVDSAQKFDKAVAGIYKVTASALHIRAGAGTGKTSLGTLKNGETVYNYGYYTTASGVAWLYVKTSGGIVGFCSSQYLSKC